MLSLMVLEVVTITNYGGASEDKVGIMTTPKFPCFQNEGHDENHDELMVNSPAFNFFARGLTTSNFSIN